MSLLFWKSRVAAVVAGDAVLAEQRTVRDHMFGCDECRKYYDALTGQARLLSTKGAPASADARELGRLMDALDAPAVPVVAPRGSRAWMWAPIGAVAVALLIFFIPRGSPEVGVRGGGTEAPVQPSVRVYARAADGSRPIRLAAELPGSGEGKVQNDEWVQVAPSRVLPGWRYVADGDGRQVELSSDSAVQLSAGRWTVQVLAPGLHPADLGVIEVMGPRDAATE